MWEFRFFSQKIIIKSSFYSTVQKHWKKETMEPDQQRSPLKKFQQSSEKSFPQLFGDQTWTKTYVGKGAYIHAELPFSHPPLVGWVMGNCILLPFSLSVFFFSPSPLSSPLLSPSFVTICEAISGCNFPSSLCTYSADWLLLPSPFSPPPPPHSAYPFKVFARQGCQTFKKKQKKNNQKLEKMAYDGCHTSFQVLSIYVPKMAVQTAPSGKPGVWLAAAAASDFLLGCRNRFILEIFMVLASLPFPLFECAKVSGLFCLFLLPTYHTISQMKGKKIILFNPCCSSWALLIWFLVVEGREPLPPSNFRV